MVLSIEFVERLIELMSCLDDYKIIFEYEALVDLLKYLKEGKTAEIKKLGSDEMLCWEIDDD